MTRIVVFDLAEHERDALAAWSAAHPDIDVAATTDGLGADTLPLCAGADAVALLPLRDLHDPGLYAALEGAGVRVIAMRMAGFNYVLPDVARRHGIAVTNVPAYSPQAVAEMALLMLLHLNRQIGEVERRAAVGDYRWGGVMGREIRSQTVGIVGAGRIGSLMARFCRALGAQVLAYDIAPRDDLDGILTYVDSLDELLQGSDVVSLHTPLTDATRHMINADTIARMQPGAVLINCARGGIVDPDALIDGLDSGQIGAAGLDTMENEDGLFDANPGLERVAPTLYGRLAGRSNVLSTPHVAFFTDIAVHNMVTFGLDNALAVATGAPMPDGRAPDIVN